MNKKFIYLLLAFSLSLFAFTACSDDDDDLRLEQNEVSVFLSETATVKITSGNGDYKVTPVDATIATATVSGNTITVTGVKAGETNVTITDKENKSTILKVTVTTLADYVAATYNGDLNITLPGSENPIVEEGKDIVLSKSGDKVKMSLANFTFDNIPVGDIVVDNIPVTRGENGVINVVETTVSLNLPVSPDPINVTVSGTVATKAAKATEQVKTEQVLDLTISVADVFPAPIVVTFSGAKKAS